MIFEKNCVHNKESWNGYECGGNSHSYSQGKTLIMVVNKVSLPTYHLNLDREKGLHTTSML
jgi:hypothetical protein